MKLMAPWMIRFKTLGTLGLLLAAGTAGVGGGLQARGQAAPPDATLTAEEALLKQTFNATRDGRMITTVLRQSQDKALLPLFEKLFQASKDDRQVEAMVSLVLLSKAPNHLDITKLLKAQDLPMGGSALAALIEANVISDAQLQQVATEAPDAAQRVMAVSELNRHGTLKDRKMLLILANDHKDSVRYYAAVSLLEKCTAEENAAGLAALRDLQEKNEPRQEPIQSLMLLRVRKEKMQAAAPWVQDIAKDEKLSISLRITAVSVLLSLERGDGPRILTDMIAHTTQSFDQVKLGLIAIEQAKQLKPASSEPLAASKVKLVASIGTMARQAAEGADVTPQLVKLLQEGHPILLDWALLYAERTDGSRQLALREAILRQAAVLDNRREQDYERGAIVAEKLAGDDEKAGGATTVAAPDSPGRKVLQRALESENIGMIEATLLGLARSNQNNLSPLVLPLWKPAFYKKSKNEAAANLAALVLAREGHQEPLAYLKTMTDTAENSGYRALAGWYYAKLTNQSDALLVRVVSSAK